MRTAEGFHTLSKRKRSISFSLKPENNAMPKLADEDLREIPFPAESLKKFDYESVNKKDVLLRLARHFWESIFRMWGKVPVWVDVMDFIVWIGLHVPLSSPIAEEMRPEDPDNEVEHPDYSQIPDRMYYDPDMIKGWAKNFSNCLSEKEKAAFKRYYGKGSKLKDIAGDLGYRGSSGASYILDCVERKLRLFLRDLPWLSPDDKNDEAFTLFFDTLLSALKKQVSEP